MDPLPADLCAMLSGWSEQEKLTAGDGASGDQFGWSVALDGDTALIGTRLANVDGNSNQGAAYIYQRTGSTWTEQAKLTASDGAAGDTFGFSVALDDDTALIGAYRANVGGNSNQGAAYIFQRTGSTWTEQTKLTAGDGAAEDFFGWSVALDDDTALIGAYAVKVDGNFWQGAAYFYQETGSTWSEQAKITASDGAAYELFGFRVMVDGETALVGAPFANVDGTNNQGAAYTYQRTGSTWTEQTKLTAGDGAAGDRFGTFISLDGDTALLSAHLDDGQNTDSGSVYVFTQSGSSWSEQFKLTASDGAGGDRFGTFVALDGDTALIGAPFVNMGVNDNQGAAYTYQRTGSTWTEQAKLTASDGAANDFFGATGALDGDTALVSAYLTDVDGNSDQGATYLFRNLMGII